MQKKLIRCDYTDKEHTENGVRMTVFPIVRCTFSLIKSL